MSDTTIKKARKLQGLLTLPGIGTSVRAWIPLPDAAPGEREGPVWAASLSLDWGELPGPKDAAGAASGTTRTIAIAPDATGDGVDGGAAPSPGAGSS